MPTESTEVIESTPDLPIQGEDEFAAARAAMIETSAPAEDSSPADTPTSDSPKRGADGKFVKQEDEEEGDDTLQASDADEDESDGEEGDAEEEVSADSEDEGGEEVLDLDDDVLVEVAVDGQVQEVSLKDLKADFSGRKYIEKNIQQAVETRKAVEAQAQTLYQNNQQLLERLQRIDGMLQGVTEPQIDWERLKVENPQEYVIRREELREAQEQQAKIQAEMQRVQQENQKLQEQAVRRYTQEQAERLVKVIPEFGDPEKSKSLMKGITEAADYYGFTPQELGTITDHRVLVALHDLMKFRKVTTEREKAETQMATEPKTRKRIKLKSAARKTQRSTQQKQERAAIQRARESGRPEDVAAMLLVPSSRT